jgi:hypothetical protein
MTAPVHASAYSLEIEHPRTGATSFEGYTSLAAVVARAATLIQAGYNIGIWSAVSVGRRPRGPIAANDDVWIEMLSKRLTG